MPKDTEYEEIQHIIISTAVALLGFAAVSVGIGNRKTESSGQRSGILIIYRSTQPTTEAIEFHISGIIS